MKKEKKELTVEEIDFLTSFKDKVIIANWCQSKVWSNEVEIKWSMFYKLVKEKLIQIVKVESKFETSYRIS